jgi:hypothetical protein
VDTERAETCLRLMAEAELRRAQALPRDAKPGPHDQGSGWACLARLRYAASALAAVGAIEADVAETVVEDLSVALIVRHRVGRRRLSSRASAVTRRLLASGAASPLPLSLSLSFGGRHGGSVQVVPVGRRLPVSAGEVTADLFLTSMIRIQERTLFAITGQAGQGPNPRPARPLEHLQADDEVGNSYGVSLTGGFSRGTMAGWLMVHPELPPDVRWIELHSGPGTARLRVDVAAPPTPADVRTEPIAPAAPGERLLDSLAAGMLAALPDGDDWPVSLDETVAALEDLGLLPAGSPATSRLAELGRQAGLRTVPGLVAARLAGTIAPAELPEAWTSVVAYFRRRHRPAGKWAVAPIAVPLPECDGVRFILTGLESRADGTMLTGMSFGLSFEHRHQPDCLCLTRWFPWWIRDNTGQWHVAAFENYHSTDGESGTLGLRVVPPLAQPVTQLDVIINGPSQRIRVRVPVDWVALRG